MNRIKLANILYKINSGVIIVLVTENKEYALDTFEINAYDYWLIPYSKERIISALGRLEEFHNLFYIIKSDRISVIKNEIIYVIHISDIYYIEAIGRGVNIYAMQRILYIYLRTRYLKLKKDFQLMNFINHTS